MRILVDANLSDKVARELRELGVEAIHVDDLGMRAASDAEILERAAHDGLVVVTLDDDFPQLLALSRAGVPLAVHLRGVAHLHPHQHVALSIAAMPEIEREIGEGPSMISLTVGRMRARRLPLR
ncbi:MAG: DUF5615 family PIN-like protein [Actinomycetia bacterium]|nr:DUF5615 family PIN-like protein [Actinomycetes bacterium]